MNPICPSCQSERCMKKKIVFNRSYPGLIIRLTVGLIFLSEGIQKMIFPESLGVGRFAKLGITPPFFWANFTSAFEITCSFLIIIGLFTRLAVIPLLVIMIGAFVTTKWPEFLDKGFWPLLHDGRTDFAMTMLLIFLLIYGSGQHSLDSIRNAKQRN
jgi:putative oxidoreductase